MEPLNSPQGVDEERGISNNNVSEIAHEEDVDVDVIEIEMADADIDEAIAKLATLKTTKGSTTLELAEDVEVNITYTDSSEEEE